MSEEELWEKINKLEIPDSFKQFIFERELIKILSRERKAEMMYRAYWEKRK